MNLTQALLILRARWPIVVLAPLLALAAAIGVTMMTPKTYQATTSLVLNYKGSDPVTGQAMASQLLPGYMQTQIEIVGSMSVALKVVDALKLTETPNVQTHFLNATGGKGELRDWLAAGLLGKLAVQPARESSVLQISYIGTDPSMAARVANAFAAAYLQTSIDLKVQPSQRTAVYFDDQVKVLRDKLETAQQRLSKYQQENGIVSTDRSLDVETVRLNELSSQAVVAQGLAMEASARGRSAAGGVGSPDVANNPMIQNLKVALGVAESKLSEIAQRLDKNHPQYQSAKAEVDKLRADLAAQVAATSATVSANATILRQRGDEAAAALRTQRDKVLRLNRARDELTVLSKEVDSAQRAYDSVANRLALTNIEAQANQSDVAVLTPALAPFKPFGPKLVLNALIGLAAGLLLGVGGAMLLELMDRRVRSAHDLRESAGLVLLGSIGSAPVKRQRRVA
ncbi:chain length determinant protein EpsF [Massilia sp. CF038]|uniref:chain length determinant protein EpsF n=1 Tax=Massilia sp. CF038 TaxID=1881045 RepID=UPI00090FB70F|nr:chain length determinant protein EpsF [Massilia sp. CF038]SHH11986.1 chain length determinant protein EpsF [Massilia sp. CF038]